VPIFKDYQIFEGRLNSERKETKTHSKVELAGRSITVEENQNMINW
jgi:hypothetical protein